jgi:alkylated DNA repair dioxygenase AlkB
LYYVAAAISLHDARVLDLAPTWPDPSASSLRHRRSASPLRFGAWLDVSPGLADAQADELFEQVRGTVPWQAERRQMYDTVVDVPRLTRFYRTGEPLAALPMLAEACEALSAHYHRDARRRLHSAGMCLYRDGRDSVAWHGDPSAAAPSPTRWWPSCPSAPTRTLCLRPAEAADGSMRIPLGHGDLATMGGSCQRTWEHAIPKVAKPVGPRMSIQFRPAGVR